jgi:hypothetical protein
MNDFDLNELTKNGSNLTVEFNGWDNNFYYDTNPTVLVLNLVDLFFIIICFLWGGWKIIQFLDRDQFGLKIAPVCLVLELLNSVTRFVNAILRIDCQMRSDYIDIEPPRTFLYSFSFVFNLSSGIFIIFFWMNLISMKIYKGHLLEKSFWPSFVLVVGFFILVLVVGILNMVYNDIRIVYYIAALILPICFIIAIFYFITAYRVFKYTKERSGSEDLQKIAVKIVLSGVCFIAMIVVSILDLIDPNPMAHMIGIFLLHLLQSARSLLQIDVFGTLKKNSDPVVIMDKSTYKTSISTKENISRAEEE